MAWALARQQNSPALTLVRAAADSSALVTLGLAAVPMLDTDRYRGELTRRAAGPLTIASAIWLVAELLRLCVAAAGRGAVVWCAGGVNPHDRAPRPMGQGVAELLAAVAGVCGGVAGRRRSGSDDDPPIT
ncbi:MAG: hypothetical protein NVSMB60_14730 [Mycobacterium sp.]